MDHRNSAEQHQQQVDNGKTIKLKKLERGKDIRAWNIRKMSKRKLHKREQRPIKPPGFKIVPMSVGENIRVQLINGKIRVNLGKRYMSLKRWQALKNSFQMVDGAILKIQRKTKME